mmetsp:Transcript_975/g.2693  ORF Transcript_975/g.2693 Transcript_975/m.2693 type:complete len:422 (+) Transcript_975:27-1292(+)
MVLYYFPIKIVPCCSALEPCEELLGGADGLDEPVHLLLGVVDVEGCSRCGRDAQSRVQGLRAVVARTDRDAILVDEGGKVIRVHPRARERGERSARRARRGSVHSETVDGAQLRLEIRRKLRLVGVHCVHAQAAEVVHSRTQAHSLRDRWRARFKAARGGCKGGALEGHLVDHLAPRLVGRHGLEHVKAAPEEADARGPAHLVARCHDPIHPQRLDVHRHVRHGLACVQEHLGAHGARGGHHGGDGELAAEHVGHVWEGHKLGVVAEEGEEVREVDAPRVRVHPRVLDHGSRALREELPGHHVGVVLHLAHHDLVTGAHVIQAPRVRDEVDGLRRATREDDFPPRCCVDKLCHLVPRTLVRIRGAHGEGVGAAVHVGVITLIVVAHRLDDFSRLLRRGGTVEVDQGAILVDCLLQCRKVAT